MPREPPSDQLPTPPIHPRRRAIRLRPALRRVDLLSGSGARRVSWSQKRRGERWVSSRRSDPRRFGIDLQSDGGFWSPTTQFPPDRWRSNFRRPESRYVGEREQRR
ncbi:hypothetical protein NL676_034965 [Syzygium grande]|nr:hypothetical protein NL676_034965 [Syzygium grande]